MLTTNTKAIHTELVGALRKCFPLIHPLASREGFSISGTDEGLFSRFLNQDLRQREERTLDPARLLGALLARDNARHLATQLDPDYRLHRRLVCEGILAEVSHEIITLRERELGAPLSRAHTEALQQQLSRYYQGVMRPYIVALHERKTDPAAKKAALPNGFLSGHQGTLNSMVLIEHVLTAEAGLTLSQQMEGIGQGTFNVDFFGAHHLGGMLTSKFNNSPGDALNTYFHTHRSHRVRRSSEHLGKEHFPQANSLWFEHGSEDSSPGEGWVYNKQRGGWTNNALAHTAIGQVIDHLIGNPSGRPLPLASHINKLEKFIATATEGEFDTCKVRFNRTFGTVVPAVYDGSFATGIIDYLRHHPRMEIRNHFMNLEPYHFRRINSWHDSEGAPKIDLARRAMAEAFAALERHLEPHEFDIMKIPENFEHQWFLKDIYFCGFSPIACASGAFGSPLVNGIIDYLQHHPTPAVAAHYRGLQPRHFSRVTNGLWSMESFGDAQIPNGWRFDKDRGRFIHYAEAHKMMAELLTRLTDPEDYGLTLSDLPKKATLDHFSSVRLPFNSRARPMLSTVYGDSPRLALRDFFESSEFEAFIAERPAMQSQVTQFGGLVAYRAYAESLLTLPLRGRFEDSAAEQQSS